MHTSREKGGIVLKVLAGLFALAVVVVLGITLIGFYIARNTRVEEVHTRDGKTVDVRTPLGSVRVQEHGASPGAVDLPVYPGAKAVSSDSKVVNVQLDFLGENRLDVVVAEYLTDDSISTVSSFYRKEFPNATVKIGIDGKFEMKIDSKDGHRFVKVHTDRGQTRIALVRAGEPAQN